MKLKDFTRLKKYMMTTMSGADAEVLFAIRKANELLVAEKVDWDRVLSRMVTLEVEHAPVVRGPRTERQETEALLSAVEASDPRGSFADFVADLRRQFGETGSLSENQRAVLKRSAERSGLSW